MIYAEIQQFLSQTTTPQVVDLFDRAAVVFEQSNFEDWLDVLSNVIGDYSDEGDSGVLDIMRLRVSEMLNSLLTQHGIKLTKEAELKDRISVVEALLRVGADEDKAALRRELESNQSAPEVLACVVSLLADLRIEAVLPLVDEVSDAFVARLRSVVSDELDEQLEEVQLVGERVKAYEKYKIVFATADRWADKFAQFPQTYGQPFAIYAKYYMAQQMESDLINSADVEIAWRKICINFLGMACLSEEGVLKLSDLAKPYLEQIGTDLGQVTQMHIKLNNLVMEYNRAQT